jgi:hypothetical protein
MSDQVTIGHTQRTVNFHVYIDKQFEARFAHKQFLDAFHADLSQCLVPNRGNRFRIRLDVHQLADTSKKQLSGRPHDRSNDDQSCKFVRADPCRTTEFDESQAYQHGQRTKRIAWIMALASYFVTIAAGLWKYRRIPSYHTYAAKVTQCFVLVGVVFLMLDYTVWLFRIAAIAVTLTNLETLLMTWVLPKWRADVLSLLHAIRTKSKGTGSSS